MGFECGFNMVKKYKDSTMNDVLSVQNYINWRDNEWNRKNFKTYYEYCQAYNIDYSAIPAQDKIEFYDTNRAGEYGEIYETIEFWCSIGKIIDLRINRDNMHPDDVQVDEAMVNSLQSWVSEYKSLNKLIPVQILKAYTDEDNKVGSLVNCEGVEVMDELGNRKFINSSNTVIYVSPDGFDSEEEYAINKLDTVLNKIKSLLNDYIIWYYRSY